MWPYRVLDMTNIIGAAVAALLVIRYYLPLEAPDRRALEGASAVDAARQAGTDHRPAHL
jgi:hypothetical protein